MLSSDEVFAEAFGYRNNAARRARFPRAIGGRGR
jgi:hypothetical protein